ncbi:MAG: hypothetical protein AAB834_04475 [Patescibacteria group bacterium]
MSAEQTAVMFDSTFNEGGNVVLVGLKRAPHEGWGGAMTTAFAGQITTEVLGYRPGGSDEALFSDAAQLAGEQPPLSPEGAGMLYAAVHRAINARRAAENEGVQA